MEKVQISYEAFKELCLGICREVEAAGKTVDGVLCIVRGGMTAAHIVAKHFGVPVAFAAFYEPGKVSFMGLEKNKQYLVIDDMVDKGRTMDAVILALPPERDGNDYIFTAVFQVGNYAVDYVGMVVRNQWIVMPNEDINKVVVGDKGLFSEGKSSYGKQA